MIIQSLHKISRIKNQESRIKTLLSWFLVLLSYSLFSQDSIVPQTSISEKTNLEFQEHFFEATTQKAIYNYRKAIRSLEECNQLIPNNKAVLFELAKNYYKINKISIAVEYCNQALQKDPTNIWMLELLVAIHKKGRNFNDAITVQEQIVKNYPKKKQQLVFLHLKNNDVKSAKKILAELEKDKLLNFRLRKIQNNLNWSSKAKKRKPVARAKKNDLKTQFKQDKSFKTLKDLLTKFEAENNSELLAYSKQGLALFPAQPFVYLMNGKALNKKGDFKNAVYSLQNGIDFIIDDTKMEKQFFSELIKAYKALGDKKNIKKYRKKLKS